MNEKIKGEVVLFKGGRKSSEGVGQCSTQGCRNRATVRDIGVGGVISYCNECFAKMLGGTNRPNFTKCG